MLFSLPKLKPIFLCLVNQFIYPRQIMKATTAVSIATIYLVVFYILLHSDASLLLTGFVFLSMPLVIIGMVFVVLLDDSVKYPELPSNDEWGYSDKNRDDLWIV